jgi:O-acetyl-ADP-ribose deacetylase (regulator of RNase III)
MEYNEINGDLISLAKKGKFDVITHGCNCMSNMGAGIAVPMNYTFDCSRFDMELQGPSMLKLGNIDFQHFVLGEYSMWNLEDADNKKGEPILTVVNSYTQNRPGIRFKPLDYEALTLCMRKINYQFKGMHIGLPKIGAGLAGGDWNRIKEIIKTELTDCKVTVVIYDK